MKTLILPLIVSLTSLTLSSCTSMYTPPANNTPNRGLIHNLRYVEPEDLGECDYFTASLSGTHGIAPLVKRRF